VTFLELLVVLVIVGVLSSLSLVSWKSVLLRLQGFGCAGEMRDALTLARMDALSHKRNTGVLLDPTPTAPRYLIFVDSTFPGGPDGKYTAGETILQPWTDLPKKPTILVTHSTVSPDPAPRACNASSSTPAVDAPSGTYPIVFHPDGRAWTAFSSKLFAPTGSDTFLVEVLPATGLVSLLH
jgi:hypothetical protein